MGTQTCVMVTVLLLLCTWTQVDGARILLVPGPHYSHVNFFSVAGRALADAGHDVYVLTIFNFEPVVRKHDLNPLIHTPPDKQDYYTRMEPLINGVLKGTQNGAVLVTTFLPMVADICVEILRNEKLMAEVDALKFDLALQEGVLFFSCLYAIPYRFGIPYITLSAMTDPWTHGVSAMPSVEATQVSTFTNEMTFFQRLTNIFPYLLMYINPVSYLYSESILGEFAADKPKTTFRELARNSEMVLINGDVNCVDYPRVSAPNYRFIGGASAKPAKPLPDDLEEFAQGADHGVVILTFGSVKFLHSVWPKIKTKFMKAFARLPQRVIVQYSLDDVSDAPPNVKLVKWLPQNDLLGHSKTKLFITHGGNNGQLEAIYHGVPLLTVPFAGDQAFNGARAVGRGYGLMVDKLEVTEDELYESMKEILTNPKYSDNVMRCSGIIKSLPSSSESITFWVNHILRFGGSHFTPPSHNLNLFQMLMVDVWFFLFSVLLINVMVGLCCCRFLYRKCCRAKPKAKSD